VNARLVMGASALFLGVLGVGASFFPQEIVAWGGTQPVPAVVLLVQIAGALALGCAFVNWMGRNLVMGGLYGRPVALGNFLHFTVGTIVLTKAVLGGQTAPWIMTCGALYAVFCISFGAILFGPSPQKS
jgi:hypothetical protein